jgi:ferredoxin
VTSLLAWLRVKIGLQVVSARISVDKCNGCLTCVSACTFNVLSPQALKQATEAGEDLVTSPECTNCGDCVSVCPEGAVDLVSGSRVITGPAVRRRAFALALTFFVFLTVFLWAQFIPMFMPK